MCRCARKLVGLTEAIRFPVFLNRTVYDAYVTVPPEVSGQDEAGRLWDGRYKRMLDVGFVALAKAGDGVVVRMVVSQEIPNANVSVRGPFDFAGTANTLSVAIEQQRQHGAGRVLRRTAPSRVNAGLVIGNLGDHFQNEMNKIVVLDPVAKIRRKQHGGISVDADEVFCHGTTSLPSTTIGASKARQSPQNYEICQNQTSGASPNAYPDLEKANPAAVQAIRTIGTNALPYYLQWLKYEPSQWRATLRRKLPRWAVTNQTVSSWLDDPAGWRAIYGYRGIEILGTNAVGAIPELTDMLNDSNEPWTAQRAMGALCLFGSTSIPVLQAAFANTNRIDRWRVTSALGYMGRVGHTNACLPILLEALSDSDSEVRMEATNAVRSLAPQFLPDPAAN